MNKQNIPKNVLPYNFEIDGITYFELKGRCKGTGTIAFVSSPRWNVVSKYNWYLSKSGYPICYELGKMHLHRFVYSYIFGQYPPSEMYVDHIDRNKLNNTDQNLRLVTPQENSFNRTTKSNKKGVRKVSKNNYTACICKDGLKKEIKNIPTEEQAAEIYNMMAEELFGSFACPNNIDTFNIP